MSELVISAQDARNLTDKIKAGTAALWELIKEAYASRAWASLGYASWDDYCTQEFGTSRIRLPREERREVVASMREIGMSPTAIGQATGISRRTVNRELSQWANAHPDEELTPVTGTDGKTYTPRPQPKPEPMEPFDHEEFERKRAWARTQSTAPGSGQEILNAPNPARRNARMFDATNNLRRAHEELTSAAEIIADIGGVKQFTPMIAELQKVLAIIEQTNNGSDMDTELQNMIAGEN